METSRYRGAGKASADPSLNGALPADRLGRHLHDLRISVTDRCNFRCVYCMPKEVFGPGFRFLPKEEILTFEEILRLTRVFVCLGVEKARITGGEPLLRRNLETLVRMLSGIPGIGDLTMTTNASLLPGRAHALRDAGLRRITVSLDALDDDVFRAMSSVEVPVRRVLDGIRDAEAAGLVPVKVNMVVKRGVNEDQILKMAEYFRGTGHILRFIEFMDVGNSNGWRMDEVVSAREIRDHVAARWPLEPVEANYRGEVADRYRYADGGGEIGIIGSVTLPFCGDCNRARLTADGEFFTCLFAGKGHSLRSLLRDNRSDDEIAEHVRGIWAGRRDRYSELRSEATVALPRVEMSRIGG
ncbi:MAG: GTP 3',8-cyclase MoaA [Gemmatimonadetes bacterium]|nr:GTP 3',8-cyclase MoaA [Gemmatimonadota bacterium]